MNLCVLYKFHVSSAPTPLDDITLNPFSSDFGGLFGLQQDLQNHRELQCCAQRPSRWNHLIVTAGNFKLDMQVSLVSIFKKLWHFTILTKTREERVNIKVNMNWQARTHTNSDVDLHSSGDLLFHETTKTAQCLRSCSKFANQFGSSLPLQWAHLSTAACPSSFLSELHRALARIFPSNLWRAFFLKIWLLGTATQ